MKLSLRKFLIYIGSTLIFLTWFSCEIDLEEMNVDPTRVSVIPTEFLFTNAVRKTFRDNNSTLHYRFCAQYAHVYVGIGIDRMPDEYKILYAQDFYGEIFRGIYQGAIAYSNEILRLTREGPQQNMVQHALADIIAVVNYARLADTFGDIPYLQGGWGQEGILLPKYDPQEFIYRDIMDRLKSNIEVLKSADPSDAFPGADPMYENDLEKWVRFANSFRLRLAMRTRFVDPQNAEIVISECLNDPLIESNDHNATLPGYDKDDASLYNPWFETFNYYRFLISERIVKWLEDTFDPRLTVLINPNSEGNYIGIPNGLGDDAFASWNKKLTSTPASPLVAKDAVMYLLTAAEVRFLMAEAALFGIGDIGDPNQLYQEGIRLSMEQWQVPEDSVNQFIDNQPEASLSGTPEEQFEQISNQMWVALIPNFIEAYANIRRTGYPVIPRRLPPVYGLGDTDGYLPTRLRYPVEEELNNPDNYQEALERQGPDNITTKLWWDVRD